MAPSPSHSQSLLPNPGLLILDRIEETRIDSACAFMWSRNPSARCAVKPRDSDIGAIAGFCRISPGKVCPFSCGRPSAGFVVAMLRALVRSSVSGCRGLYVSTGVKPSEPPRSCGWSATWLAAYRASGSSRDCASRRVMTRSYAECARSRRPFAISASMIGPGAKARNMERFSSI